MKIAHRTMKVIAEGNEGRTKKEKSAGRKRERRVKSQCVSDVKKDEPERTESAAENVRDELLIYLRCANCVRAEATGGKFLSAKRITRTGRHLYGKHLPA